MFIKTLVFRYNLPINVQENCIFSIFETLYNSGYKLNRYEEENYD